VQQFDLKQTAGPEQPQSAGHVVQVSDAVQAPSPHPTHCPLALQASVPEHVPQLPPQPLLPHCLPEHWGLQQFEL
jgi:hypothetical protein